MKNDDTHHADEENSEERPPRQRPVYDAEEIDQLRKRLYSRNASNIPSSRHTLPPKVDMVSMQPEPRAIYEGEPTLPSQEHVAIEDTAHTTVSKTVREAPMSDTIEDMPRKSKRHTFRKTIAVIGVVFFAVALLASSFIMFWGGNTISGENISISVSGVTSVGGGAEYEFQVSVANQNTVSIQSATLVVEYPKGTRLATDSDKEVSIHRQALNTIATGELVNIPLKVRMYGEEGEEKEIKVWIEYRVAGSNATFEKYSEPLRLTVTTSPVIVSFNTVKNISSGQEIEIDVIVQSNSTAPLTDILVKIAYPSGFDFTDAEPETVSGEDVWRFSQIKPEEKKTITIKGILTGHEDDVQEFSATVGVPKEGSANTLASQLATAKVAIGIEQPSLNTNVSINGSSDKIVVINSDTEAKVQIEYVNALDATLYDGKVVMRLEGNVLPSYKVQSEGKYSRSQNTITWESDDFNELKEITPGKKVKFEVSLSPEGVTQTSPEMKMTIAVEGSRRYANRAPQVLLGETGRTIKVEGIPTLSSMTNYEEGPFVNTGPVPPVAGKVTQYTYLLWAKAGLNDLTGAEVTAILPQSVSWLDLATPGDDVVFSPGTRTMKWSIGDLKAGEEAHVGIQVSLLPTESQIGSVPTILDTQRFKATDRFTGTTVRSNASALTTNFTNNPKNDIGRVEAR